MSRLESFPGGDLIEKGLADLASHKLSEEALLVLIARPRLLGQGFVVPDRPELARPIEHLLYSRLQERLGTGAYSAYNALIRRIVSFANAYDRRVGEDEPCAT